MAEGAAGALVLHGYTGTPQSVAGLAAALSAAGLLVDAPLLPGHGTSIDDLASTRWEAWAAAAEDAYARLAARAGRVVVTGLSVGGTLAAWLASQHPEVAGLACINPFVDPPAASFRDILAGFLAAGGRLLPGIGGDLADPGAREDAYPEMPIEPLLSLCHALEDLLPRLERIACPVLVVTSRTDHVVPPVSSDVLALRVAGPVERVWLEDSHHVATLDLDREEVERRVVEFALRVTGAARPPAYDAAMGQAISREQVAHVARLARLALTDEELDRFTGQLAAVLDNAAGVAALDTAGVPPTAHPLPLVNVLRDDVPRPGLDRAEVLAAAPAAEDGRFRVPRILGDEP